MEGDYLLSEVGCGPCYFSNFKQRLIHDILYVVCDSTVFSITIAGVCQYPVFCLRSLACYDSPTALCFIMRSNELQLNASKHALGMHLPFLRTADVVVCYLVHVTRVQTHCRAIWPRQSTNSIPFTICLQCPIPSPGRALHLLQCEAVRPDTRAWHLSPWNLLPGSPRLRDASSYWLIFCDGNCFVSVKSSGSILIRIFLHVFRTFPCSHKLWCTHFMFQWKPTCFRWKGSP